MLTTEKVSVVDVEQAGKKIFRQIDVNYRDLTVNACCPMSTSCSSSFTKLPGRSATKLVDVNSKYLYRVSSLVFNILLKMSVIVAYTFKYEIYIYIVYWFST